MVKTAWWKVNGITERIRNRILAEWVCSQELTANWAELSVKTKEGDSNINRISPMGEVWSLSWTLYRADSVSVGGDLEGNCKTTDPKVHCVKNRELDSVWDDEIDGLSWEQGGREQKLLADIVLDKGLSANYYFTIDWSDDDCRETCFSCDTYEVVDE